ncbi:MAG: hypothetical protein COA45_11400 [Zetaproteobacteria bacterium]|nr:MAG: hypothetical protein COA45_11400 [Zetaproteobacteria bacterium]
MFTLEKKQLAFLVNDDLFAETMLIRLQKKGFYTNIFYTSVSLRFAMEHSKSYPDVLVIDMDCFDFADLPVRRDTNMPKIFALSNRSDMDTRLKAAQANVSDFVLKPIDADQLTEKIVDSFGVRNKVVYDVLIVDDDPFTLRLLQKLLETENIRVRFIENPVKVLEELEHHKPDLILLDYYMPYANGLDINRVIRQIYSISEIPILFMTGSKDPKILSDIRKESHFEPILKPVSPGGLVERVLDIII